ncbi:MAG: hypothetical protein D3915_04445 [Candidatus Electrothrix sp. AU1_5]|nr:hypothetical protein [Candidatus Electrothrix gigas]MCI5227576.1 hypothetical protein [Candidatus Electrothrix gigas]
MRTTSGKCVVLVQRDAQRDGVYVSTGSKEDIPFVCCIFSLLNQEVFVVLNPFFSYIFYENMRVLSQSLWIAFSFPEKSFLSLQQVCSK